jgi:hypothetical protein
MIPALFYFTAGLWLVRRRNLPAVLLAWLLAGCAILFHQMTVLLALALSVGRLIGARQDPAERRRAWWHAGA